MSSRWRRFWRVFFMLEKHHAKWALRENPELRHLPPGAPGWRARLRIALVLMVAMLVWFGIVEGAIWILLSAVGSAVPPRRIGYVALGLTGAQFGGAIMLALWVARRMMNHAIRRAVQRKGIPICIRCGYEPGSWTDRCPECGRPISRPKHTERAERTEK